MKWLLALGAVQRQENLSARLLLLFPAQLETIKDISLDAAQNTTLSEVCTKIKCHKKTFAMASQRYIMVGSQTWAFGGISGEQLP